MNTGGYAYHSHRQYAWLYRARQLAIHVGDGCDSKSDWREREMDSIARYAPRPVTKEYVLHHVVNEVRLV